MLMHSIRFLFLLAAVAHAASPIVLENAAMRRSFEVADGRLRTVEIENKQTGAVVKPTSCPEFVLRLSQGTDRTTPDTVVTAEDFKVTGSERKVIGDMTFHKFELECAEYGLTVKVDYLLFARDFFMRKWLKISSSQPWVLERVDVEALGIADAYQPYTKDAITAHAPGNWSPNLGQPLYTRESGMFWGVEFPAARNEVRDGMLRVGHLRGMPLTKEPSITYPAVCGVADDPGFVQDAFFRYIDRTRVRPLRLQTQYNSWFDYGGGVSREKFANSALKIHEELVTTRGVRPLSQYVIDDGWQDTGADWSGKVWKVNHKFDAEFSGVRKVMDETGSELGLWLSPGCLFGASRQVPRLREQGFEAMDDWMSMAGPKYMQALEERMVELTRQGVGFFKLDGVFGHLNLRNFELNGSRYGLPEMPQLGTKGMKAGAKELNDPKFDELKLYYLSAGTERLMTLFARLARIDPDIYLVISNGAYLSPWWLQHVDAVWMINAGDAAGGSSRTGELVYRDGRYHKIFVTEQTQFPLNAVFNHEPKKTSTGETKEVFRKYLYMHLSRGTGFVELYIKPFVLQAADWDVLAEGMLWAEEMLPAFKFSRMHGGDPLKKEVYGYAGWTEDGGYVSVHNPSGEEREYAVTLDRALGMGVGMGTLLVSSPMEEGVQGLPKTVKPGEVLKLQLAPGEIRLLHFDRRARDWSALRALQTRTPDPEPVDLTGHPVLGVWAYAHGGVSHTRTFTADGFCVLRSREDVQWRKSFDVISATEVSVRGGLRHVIRQDGTMDIEGRYRARKQ
jgi:hypothetical protein